MNIEYVQNLREKLQRRIDQLNLPNDQMRIFLFPSSLKQYWSFLQSNSVVVSILDELSSRFSSIQNKIDFSFSSCDIYDTYSENAAACYFILQKLASLNDEQVINDQQWLRFLDSNEFKYTFLSNLHQYIDEELSNGRFTLALLTRYKHKCEWFQREKLLNLWQQNLQKGEKFLASHLYEYLHDHGLDFTIEPYSISGEVDLIINQKGDERLIADAKIFDGESRGKNYICKGFRQVYEYLRDYNQSSGYLVMYKVCDKDLRLSLSNQLQLTPFIIHNHKTIFFIVIDICYYDSSASQRRKLKSVEIKEDDLIQILASELPEETL